jgi:hypothetical protein
LKTLYLFPNGNTGVFDEDGHQIPKLQKPWLTKFAEFLKEQGEDPTQMEIILPNGKRAILIDLEHGYNWEIK